MGLGTTKIDRAFLDLRIWTYSRHHSLESTLRRQKIYVLKLLYSALQWQQVLYLLFLRLPDTDLCKRGVWLFIHDNDTSI